MGLNSLVDLWEILWGEVRPTVVKWEPRVLATIRRSAINVFWSFSTGAFKGECLPESLWTFCQTKRYIYSKGGNVGMPAFGNWKADSAFKEVRGLLKRNEGWHWIGGVLVKAVGVPGSTLSLKSFGTVRVPPRNPFRVIRLSGVWDGCKCCTKDRDCEEGQ